LALLAPRGRCAQAPSEERPRQPFCACSYRISLSLNRTTEWGSRWPRLATAYLTCTSVPFLIATTVLMAVQFAQVNGGVLPDRAPSILPAGVIGLDGWADRLLVVSYCLWQVVVGWQAIEVDRRRGRLDG